MNDTKLTVITIFSASEFSGVDGSKHKNLLSSGYLSKTKYFKLKLLKALSCKYTATLCVWDLD